MFPTKSSSKVDVRGGYLASHTDAFKLLDKKKNNLVHIYLFYFTHSCGVTFQQARKYSLILLLPGCCCAGRPCTEMSAQRGEKEGWEGGRDQYGRPAPQGSLMTYRFASLINAQLPDENGGFPPGVTGRLQSLAPLRVHVRALLRLCQI